MHTHAASAQVATRLRYCLITIYIHIYIIYTHTHHLPKLYDSTALLLDNHMLCIYIYIYA